MNEMNNILMIGAGPHYRINLQRLMNLTPLLGEPRQPNSDLSEKHFDIAASLQCQLETAIEKIIVYYARTTGLRNICLAGGTFLNVVANAKIAATGCFDDVFIQPASHDAGTSLGAAMLSSRRRDGPCRFPMSSVALGTFYSSAQIERTLQQSGVMYQKLEDADLIDFLALMLAEKRVCGLFRGRIEFGPRALGMRSLLANPMDEKMLEHINSLKGREQFRPLAPMVTEESFSKYFEGVQNRYMLFTVDVRDEMRTVIPAVTHIDGSSRTQVVREREDPFMHKLLNRFADHTGVPVLINTSLNIRGKPIVEHPTDALALLYTSGLDVLALENFVVLGVK
jgi:carbamoyltransferase